MDATFQQAVNCADDWINLAEAALLIAGDVYPDLDVPGYLWRLDSFASILEPGVRRAGGSEARGIEREAVLRVLNHFFFREVGFHGNREHYYDPRNSYLNEVLDRKTGIPISLSVIYLEVAWRLGLPLQGVGLPGHFMVSWAGPDPTLFIDVFDGGRILSVPECEERVSGIYGRRVTLQREWLQPVSRRYILARMLNNLKSVCAVLDLPEQAISAVEKLLILQPDAAEELRDLGMLHAQAGHHWNAIRCLERYLGERPGADDTGAVRQLVSTLFDRVSEP